jgi:hypothetical protein
MILSAEIVTTVTAETYPPKGEEYKYLNAIILIHEFESSRRRGRSKLSVDLNALHRSPVID